MNFHALLLQNSTRLLAKAKLTGNVFLLKVVCSHTMYDNAFVKMCVSGVLPVVPSVLWQYCSCSVCLRMEVLVLGLARRLVQRVKVFSYA